MSSKRVILALPVLLAGCASVGPTQEFAEATDEYATTAILAVDAAILAAANANSEQLRALHGDPANRASRYDSYTEAATELLASLYAMTEHLDLLRDYANALTALADPTASERSAETAQALAGRLVAASPTLRQTTYRGVPVAGAVQRIAGLRVSSKRTRVLESELRANAETVANQLELQRAFLEVLVKGLRTDMEQVIEARQFELAHAYQSNTLPAGWISERRNTLSASVMLQTLGMAESAAERLQDAWAALVAGDDPDFVSLNADIGELKRLVRVASEVNDYE